MAGHIGCGQQQPMDTTVVMEAGMDMAWDTMERTTGHQSLYMIYKFFVSIEMI